MSDYVAIQWRDSARYPDHEWYGSDHEFAPIDMLSAGILVKETDEVYVIAADWSDNRPYTPYRGVYVIPKVNVVSVERHTFSLVSHVT